MDQRPRADYFAIEPLNRSEYADAKIARHVDKAIRGFPVILNGTCKITADELDEEMENISRVPHGARRC